MTVDNIVTLGMLILLQAVLGFDNLLYISLESKRAPAKSQAIVRRLGITIAMVLRIGLLFLLTRMIAMFQSNLFAWNWRGVIEGEFNLHAVVVLLGGIFILWTATREIFHMLTIDDLHSEKRAPGSVGAIVTSIVLMNLVFSFDSILSAMALTDVFWVMATSIIVGAILMLTLADGVADFLQRNRMYEVLGLFILFVVGVMLITEGGHLAHLTLFGQPVHAMTKTTFYFVIAVLVLTDVVQSRYQKKLLAEKKAALHRNA